MPTDNSRSSPCPISAHVQLLHWLISLSMSSCSKLRCCTHATTENKNIYIYIHYYIYTHQSTNPVLHSYHAKTVVILAKHSCEGCKVSHLNWTKQPCMLKSCIQWCSNRCNHCNPPNIPEMFKDLLTSCKHPWAMNIVHAQWCLI